MYLFRLLVLALRPPRQRQVVHARQCLCGCSAEMARRDLLANRAANHAPESADEEDPGLLPPSTAPRRLEESGRMKGTRGRTMGLFLGAHPWM